MKTKFLIAVLVSLVVILGVSASMLIPANDKAKENSKAKILPVIEETAAGELELKAKGLEKVEFIHYQKGFGKSQSAKTLSCYSFLTPTKIRWKVLPVNYVINPTNPQGLDKGVINSAILTGAETWDSATSKELMNDVYTIDETAKYGVQNYKNAITFGNYPTTGVIAVTSIWYNPLTKVIVEFDIMFDTDFAWGDATSNPAVMDLQNIATHELGHGAGLGDIYSSACTEVTMYGYSEYGETKKRSLETPDITGLQTLYGI